MIAGAIFKVWQIGLKVEFEGELDASGLLVQGSGAGGGETHSLAPERSVAKRAAAEDWFGVIQVGMVEDVEELGAELQASALSEPWYGKATAHGKVDIPEARPVKHVSGCVAELIAGRVREVNGIEQPLSPGNFGRLG